MAKPKALHADLIELSRTFAGRWVAINTASSDVITDGASAGEVLAIALARGVKEPLVFKVLADYGTLAPCQR